MKNTNKTMLVLLLTLSPSLLMAAVNDELKRFHKCYALFVGERVLTTDALWKAVETGKKTGTDACMEIFDKATLISGKIAQTNGVPDEIGAKVLNNFLRFQVSQFKVPDYSKATTPGIVVYTSDVIDTYESAYHFIYSIFTPKMKYSESITRDFSLRGIRTTSAASRTRSVVRGNLPVFRQGTFKYVYDAKGVGSYVPDNLTTFSPKLVDTGILTGIIKNDTKNIITNTTYFKSSNFSNTDVNQHFGGGVIGTQPYLIGNVGKVGFNNGGTGLFRRWGKHVMDDFLCRELPSLRTTDVVKEVSITSTIPYRTGISCMACHSSMDFLAGAVRNGNRTTSHNGNDITAVGFFGRVSATSAYAPMPVEKNDASFARRPANGRLFYRSYDGSIVKEEVIGAQELGEVMAETNDFYVCAAKRYYRFLTGINVDLSDSGDINTPELGRGAEYQRNKVIQMGLDLKNHQSGRSLIKSIIEQNAFIYPDQGV